MMNIDIGQSSAVAKGIKPRIAARYPGTAQYPMARTAIKGAAILSMVFRLHFMEISCLGRLE
jgi:hypothetical protein